MGILGRHSNPIVFLPFPIMAINLQGEVSKFGKAFVSREMKEVVLDTFGQAPVGNVPECCIIPLSLGRSSGELDEISDSLVVFFHNNFFQFDLGLGSIVKRAEVCFEFVVEAVPICKPYRVRSNFAKDRWFEVLEHRTREVRDGILNFCCACSKSFGAVLEVEHTLQEEGA